VYSDKNEFKIEKTERQNLAKAMQEFIKKRIEKWKDRTKRIPVKIVRNIYTRKN
jgi:hypothetical protein